MVRQRLIDQSSCTASRVTYTQRVRLYAHPRMARLDVRLPDQLKTAVTEEAARLGITQSEFMREAPAVYVAWHRALDAVDDGASTRELRDPTVVARLLGEPGT